MNIQPYILIVPPSLERDADIILNSREIAELGNYIKLQLRKEKPFWQRKYGGLRVGKKPQLNDMIRKKYDEYSDAPERTSLPKAMRNNAYYVEASYGGYGEYNYVVKRGKILSNIVIEIFQNSP